MLRGVLFDWRGTLVVDPPDEWWVATALERIGRDPIDAAMLVDALDAALEIPEVTEPMRELDTSAELHRAATMHWFRTAGLDKELAVVLYDLDFEAENHRFFPDVAGTLRALRERDIAIGVLSDIHFDLRPEFAAAGLSEFVNAFVLSFEHGVQKPDPRIFHIGADSLGFEPHELLMVGDRASHDGGAVAVGMTTLLLPPLHVVVPRDLDRVLALVDSAG